MRSIREYQKSHAFIDFKAGFGRYEPEFWLLLGEAKSKAHHLASVPVTPAVQQRMRELYLAKGVLATAAIEGNSLNLEQVQRRIAGEKELPPSKEYLGQEIDNIVERCNQIAEDIFTNGKRPITVEDIKDYNASILNGLKFDEEVVPGKIRGHEVGVGPYKAPPPEDCTFLLGKLCDWLASEPTRIEGRPGISGLLKAILAHLYIAWIHPFGDGNGRTARLIEFRILLSGGFPDAACHLLSNHYNQTRSEYYRQLQRSHEAGPAGVEGFITYALRGFVEGLREQTDLVINQQIQITWDHFIYDLFRNSETKAGRRRRALALALTRPIPAKAAEVRDLSPAIAVAYAEVTDKTVMRDLKALAEAQLVKIEGQEARPNVDLLRAFIAPMLPQQ